MAQERYCKRDRKAQDKVEPPDDRSFLSKVKRQSVALDFEVPYPLQYKYTICLVYSINIEYNTSTFELWIKIWLY